MKELSTLSSKLLLAAALVVFPGGVSVAPAEPPATQPEEFPRPPAAAPPTSRPERTRIHYIGGSPQAAVLAVRKKINGAWKERKYTILPYDSANGKNGEIGRIDLERDPVTGKRIEADFRTGCVLLGIRKERFRFKRQIRRNDLLFREGPDEESVPAVRDRYRIYFLNAAGSLRRRWMEDEKR